MSNFNSRPALVTPSQLGDAARSVNEATATSSHATMPPVLTPRPAMYVDESCHTVAPVPCKPAPVSSPLFDSVYEIQDVEGVMAADSPVHASLSIPAISPSMLFSVPPHIKVCCDPCLIQNYLCTSERLSGLFRTLVHCRNSIGGI